MVVLDVGAHDLAFSKNFLEVGCNVIALDKSFPQGVVAPTGISLVEGDFLNFVPREKVDVLFVSYVAQFMAKDAFFAQIARHYAGCRIIAIRTFYRAPEPSKNLPIMFYEERDLSLLPEGFDSYKSATWTDEHPDMRGNVRTFFEIDLIAVKK